MLKTAIFFTAWCFAISFADKEVTILIPPYDTNEGAISVTALHDNATLIAAMEKAQKQGKMT